MPFICGFDIVNGGKTHRENPFLSSARAQWELETMAVRIFQSAKLTNFGGNFFLIVHLFRLGSSGF